MPATRNESLKRWFLSYLPIQMKRLRFSLTDERNNLLLAYTNRPAFVYDTRKIIFDPALFLHWSLCSIWTNAYRTSWIKSCWRKYKAGCQIDSYHNTKSSYRASFSPQSKSSTSWDRLGRCIINPAREPVSHLSKRSQAFNQWNQLFKIDSIDSLREASGAPRSHR